MCTYVLIITLRLRHTYGIIIINYYFFLTYIYHICVITLVIILSGYKLHENCRIYLYNVHDLKSNDMKVINIVYIGILSKTEVGM